MQKNNRYTKRLFRSKITGGARRIWTDVLGGLLYISTIIVYFNTHKWKKQTKQIHEKTIC